MNKNNIIAVKSKAFAVRIVKLYKYMYSGIYSVKTTSPERYEYRGKH